MFNNMMISFLLAILFVCQPCFTTAGFFVNHEPIDDPDFIIQEEKPVKQLMSAQFQADELTLSLHRKDNKTITARLEDEEDCIYSGYLEGCTTSSVLVTGCVGMMQSVQIQSVVFGDMVFTTRDGLVEPLEISGPIRGKRDLFNDIDYDYDDTLENLEFDELFADLGNAEADDLPPPPTKLELNINIYLDKNWEDEFGRRGGPTYAKTIVKHASLLLKHDSLDTKIDILDDSDRYFPVDQHLVPSKTVYTKKLPDVMSGPDTVNGDQTVAHVYLTVGKSRLLGLSQINGMCSAISGKPRTIIVYKESEVRTAMTVAHELGHLLGIEHDFIPGKREKKCGQGKRTGEYVMNYGDNRQKWSDCSNMDMKVYYNRVILEREVFCLKQSVAGCACNGNTDVLGNGHCKASDKPWCYVNQNVVCDDIDKYNGKFISYSACSSDGLQPVPDTTRRTTTRRTTTHRTTTRRTTTPHTTTPRTTSRRTIRRTTTRRPSSGSSGTQSGSEPCEYKCLYDGSCTSTYVGPPRRGKKRGTCFAPNQSKGTCSAVNGKQVCTADLCKGIPSECRMCNEVRSC
eukprot:GFUD01040083.1.p1 GENE.GFUD01040083.1~~GFUD01040083.1.p1  ORF type:complete len:570 (+),score=66.96 GFUD01040083.1:70-1779(+)